MLQEKCTDNALAWREAYRDAFRVSDGGVTKTIFRYAIPFLPEQEAILLAKHGFTQEELLQYYQSLVLCVQRDIQVSALLSEAGVPSVLRYESIEQTCDAETGRSFIYLQTGDIRPVTTQLFCDSVNALTALDVFSRLAMILRDIAKPPCGVTHRGLDMSQVYLTSDNKVLMGGFFYADCPSLSRFGAYLPERPEYLPPELLEGRPGSPGLDMRTLARTAWNLFSGLPMDAAFPSGYLVKPEFAPDELAQALAFGLECTDGTCNTFRRKLTDCRKKYKDDLAQAYLPVRTLARREYVVKYV